MQVANGQVDVTTYFVLRDATTRAPKTDVTVTDIDLYYVEERAAISSKIDCTALAAADSAHSDGGAFHVGQGLYRIDWPDAAFDGGVGTKVQLVVVCSGVDTAFDQVDLVAPGDLALIQGSVNDGSPLAGDFDGAGLSATNDFYNGSLLVFTSGALKGIARKITDYTGATGNLAFTTAFPSAPANGDKFVILGRID